MGCDIEPTFRYNKIKPVGTGINPLNNKEETRMKKNLGFNNERTFGVEVEFFLDRSRRRGAHADEVAQAVRNQGIECYVEGYNHMTRPHWKIVTDVSVSYEGLEIVSPILKGQEGLEELEKVLKGLSEVGAKVNRTCGIHVHNEANDFS